MSEKQIQESQVTQMKQSILQKESGVELDLERLTSLFWSRRIHMVKASCGLAALFFAASFVMPKTYESTSVVQTSSGNIDKNSYAQAMAAVAGGSGNSTVDN